MGLDVKSLEKLIGVENMPIEVQELDDDSFLKVKETLTRIGYIEKGNGNSKDTLWQTCHILHKKGRYFITHFKQMYLFDGKIQYTNLTDADVERTKYIAKLLQDWGLVKVLDESTVKDADSKINVIRFEESKDWNLKPKYHNTYKQNTGNK